MNPTWQDKKYGIELYCGDCLDVMSGLDVVDSIVCDPPYGLSFMGKKWDYDVPSVDIWREALRVLKPGAHLLSFAGTRTQHRMACNIEDAGFEIRDMIAWVYGSGFPKSLDISKAIDKAAGAEREVVGEYKMPSDSDAGNAGKGTIMRGDGGTFTEGGNVQITAPATDAAKQWQGWGTALKPALEPITLARKPISEKTIAANVLEHGTGGLNIDGCRVGTHKVTINTFDDGAKPFGNGAGHDYSTRQSQGRFPANLIHDGSKDVLDNFPDTSSGTILPHHIRRESENNCMSGKNYARTGGAFIGDSGSAARFFYCAKTSQRERNRGCGKIRPEKRDKTRHAGQKAMGKDGSGNAYNRGAMPIKNNHPTVKPVDLMQYLCRLITPPGGIVLDCFAGSGSTALACIYENFRFIGIERDPDYFQIMVARIKQELQDKRGGILFAKHVPDKQSELFKGE